MSGVAEPIPPFPEVPVFPILAILALVQGAAVAPPTELRGEALMTALQGGGFTIVLRHARTDRSFQEAIAYVPTSRAQQRNLSDDGVHDAGLMGQVFKKYAIPFSEVIASPMYRALETAEYAARPATANMVLRTFPTGEEARKLIAEAPAPGTNRLLVTHHFVIETHVPGIKPGDIGESEAAVVRTAAGGQIELVGKILLADWQVLAGGGRAEPAGDGAAFPASPLGNLARDYVAAFNTGDTTRMGQLIERALLPNPERSTAARLASFRQLFAEIGPVTVQAIEPGGAHRLTVVGQGRPGIIRITIEEAEDKPGRAASVKFEFGRPGGHG